MNVTKSEIAVEKKPYLKELHYFRGFAILNIAIIHLWQIKYTPQAGLAMVATIKKTDFIKELIFHDSTLYFLFISGFLFQYLAKEPLVPVFYIKKLKFIVLPYLIVSIVALLTIHLLMGKGLPVDLWELFLILLKGNAQIQFWYIPFICTVFLISPLLFKIPKKIFTKLALLLLLLPLLGTRTGTNLDPLQFVFFFPLFTFGILAARHYPYILSIAKKYKWHLSAILVLSSTCLYITGLQSIYFLPHMNLTETWFYLQKMSAIMLLLHLFVKLKNKKFYLFDIFARYAFAIYFLHVLTYSVTYKFFYTEHILAFLTTWFIVPYSILVVIIMLTINLLIALGIKKIAGRSSRMIIGS